MLEFDFFLKWMKFIRIGSLACAWIYFFGYVFWAGVLIWILDDLDGGEITYTNIYSVMVLAYNLIIHTPVLMINLMIMVKEFSMEFLQLAYDVAGTSEDDYSLTVGNLEYLFIDLSNWVNPWFWAEEDATGKWDEMYE